MCIDYTDLNKHCPKDHFGLPRIDQVVDSTAGCVLLYFLDCYSGYHQIALKKEDQIKTAFITMYGKYAYKTISFGLKNAGATYQRAIQMCFADQVHQNVEAYVDDVVIKTRNPDSLIADLEETFSSLRKFRWKLNPTKCVFRVPSGKLLGFIVNNRGIDVAELSELFRFKCTNHHLQRQDDLKCTSNGITHGSVGSPPDTTTVTQDRSRLYSYKMNSRYIIAQVFIT
jgi:hypothetical protein